MEHASKALALRCSPWLHRALSLRFIAHYGIFVSTVCGMISATAFAHETGNKVVFQAGAAAGFGIAISAGGVLYWRCFNMSVWLVSLILGFCLIRPTNETAIYSLLLFLLGAIIVCADMRCKLDFPSSNLLRSAWWGGAIAAAAIIVGGVLDVVPSTKTYVTTSQTAKTSLGFWNPNTGASLLFGLVFLSFLLRERLKVVIAAFMFGSAMFAFVSRTYLVAAGVAVAAVIATRILPPAILRLVLMGLSLLIIAFCLALLVIKIEPEILLFDAVVRLDNLLSYRIAHVSRELGALSIAELLLGDWSSASRIDIGWFNVVMQYGLIVSVAAIGFYNFAVLYIPDRELPDAFLISTVFSVVSFAEQLFVVYNLTALATFVVVARLAMLVRVAPATGGNNEIRLPR